MDRFCNLVVIVIFLIKLLSNAVLENEANRNPQTGIIDELQGETEQDALDILDALLGWPDED
jgi:hypothetical protein